MKIEKLTENKIRVVIKPDDLDENNDDISLVISKAMETQSLFFNILEKAEKEVDFHTEGCKLLIEAFSSSEDFLVFTITKYSDVKSDLVETQKKKLTVKKKCVTPNSNNAIYSFDNFDSFCYFCSEFNHKHKLDEKKIAKNTSLYLYNNTYYLLLKNINTKYENLKSFYYSITEYGKLSCFSDSFQNKLLEHGKLIIKKEAINVGVKYFVN